MPKEKMPRSSEDKEKITDPLNYLAICTLEDIKILDIIDLNEFIHRIEDKTENDSGISIDADDLKEWVDEKSCSESRLLDNDNDEKLMEHRSTSNDTGAFQDLQNVDTIKHKYEFINDHSFQESLDSMRKINQLTLKDEPIIDNYKKKKT